MYFLPQLKKKREGSGDNKCYEETKARKEDRKCHGEKRGNVI